MKIKRIVFYLLFCCSAVVTRKLVSLLGVPSRSTRLEHLDIDVNIATGASGLKCREGHLACRAGNASERANLASLEILRTWRSTKPRPTWSITLVTQLSASRCALPSGLLARVLPELHSTGGNTSQVGAATGSVFRV